MSRTQFWNSKYISMSKIIYTIILVFISVQSFAQNEKNNNSEIDTKRYYFGMTLGFNSSAYKLKQSDFFVQNDTLKEITPLWKPGFQLGIVGNLRLSNFVDFRTVPSFVLREKAMRYKFKDDKEVNSSFESILFSWPFEFKFKSDRQENFRFYALLGAKGDYDFNSNSSSRKEDEIIKVKKFDFGYNMGLGFQFYFPNFILAPELKLSQGLTNSLIKGGSTEATSNAIDKLNTRMLIFSLFIEG